MLIITDRTELDEQIEKVFNGVNEDIYRTKSGADLIATLNAAKPWLICSLIHKFGGKEDGEEVGDIDGLHRRAEAGAAADFRRQGRHLRVRGRVPPHPIRRAARGDEGDPAGRDVHRLHWHPAAKADKQKSIEVFGRYIHTYKFDEAVKDGVVLDLRYEARDIDQNITSPEKIDQWFEAKTKGLTDLAKAQLKQRWGTMQKVLSPASRGWRRSSPTS